MSRSNFLTMTVISIETICTRLESRHSIYWAHLLSQLTCISRAARSLGCPIMASMVCQRRTSIKSRDIRGTGRCPFALYARAKWLNVSAFVSCSLCVCAFPPSQPDEETKGAPADVSSPPEKRRRLKQVSRAHSLLRSYLACLIA